MLLLSVTKQAKVRLKRIHNELNNDLLSMNAKLDYLFFVRNFSMAAVVALNGKNEVSDEQFVIGAYQASQVNNAWSNRATYNEILSREATSLRSKELASPPWARKKLFLLATSQ